MKKYCIPIIFFGILGLAVLAGNGRQSPPDYSAQAYPAYTSLYEAMRAWMQAQPATRSATLPASPSAATPTARSSSVIGPRDACRQRTADEQRQIDQGNQTIINRIFCPSATPQCCTFPLPGAGEPMGRCYVRGTRCPRPGPRPRPRPGPECPACGTGERCAICRPPFDGPPGTRYYTGACVPVFPPVSAIPTCSPR